MAGGPFNNYRIGSNTILKMSDEGPATLVYSILVISLINVESPISCKKTIKLTYEWKTMKSRERANLWFPSTIFLLSALLKTITYKKRVL